MVGTKLARLTDASVGLVSDIVPATPFAIGGTTVGFVPVWIWAIRPYCSVRQRFDEPSFRTHPNRPENVYPEGSVGEVADVERSDATVFVVGL